MVAAPSSTKSVFMSWRVHGTKENIAREENDCQIKQYPNRSTFTNFEKIGCKGNQDNMANLYDKLLLFSHTFNWEMNASSLNVLSSKR